MILVIGGTSESILLAEALVCHGISATVSCATDVTMDYPNSPLLVTRSGRLNRQEFLELIRNQGIHLVADVSHPYAQELKVAVAEACTEADITYLGWSRPSVLANEPDVIWANDHHEAAGKAFGLGVPVFLTIGSKNIGTYAAAAKETNARFVARVLDNPESVRECVNAGLQPSQIITGRGPFSVEANCRIIEQYKVGVMITKDSGLAGGVREKLESVRRANIKLIVVGRPDQNGLCNCTLEEFIDLVINASADALRPVLRDC